MNKRKIKITKDTIIVLMSIAAIGTSIWGYSLSKDIETKDKHINKAKAKISEYTEELKFRDEVLDNYRRNLDKLEIDLENSNKKIEEQERTIQQKNSKIKELQSKEFPTQVNSRSISRTSGSNEENMEMKLTFYGDFAHENGGYAGMDAQGNKLTNGTVASNVYPFGTQFSINGQIFTVRDRGGKNFNSSNRLDVFVPRLKGENDANYSKRISNYGIKNITAQKIS